MVPSAPIIPSSYDLRLVAISYLVAVLASYAAFDLAGRVTAAHGYARRLWIIGGAATLGLGIWSMHFIGMLALHLAIPMRYNIPLVIASFLIAIIASSIALLVASRPTLTWRVLLGGGLCMGLGIAMMHYTGMFAMVLDASMEYRPLVVCASIVIAIGASLVALWLAFHLRRTKDTTAWLTRRLGSACLMGAAIAGMHYTGMAAVSFTTEQTGHTATMLNTSPFTLALVLGVATLVILGIALLCTLIDRRFSSQAASFESLFRLSPEAIFALDVDGALRRCNLAAAQLTGYTLDTMPARPLDALLAPADQARLAGQLHQAARGVLQEGRYTLLNRAGQSLIGHATIVPIKVGDRINGVYAMIRNITQQEHAQQELREAELRFRTLVEQLPVISYIAALDEDSSTLYTSPQIETMLGFTQSEWMADHQLWRTQIHPDDIDGVLATIEDWHTTGVPAPCEYRMLTRSGAVKWFRDEGVIVKDETGEPLFLQGIMFDITESKNAEEALRRSEERNRALINAVPDLLFRLDKAGVCLDYKADALNDLFMLPPNQRGKALADLLPPNVAHALMAGIDLALTTSTVQVLEYQLLHNKHVHVFEARIVVCGADEVLAIIRNITERKHIDRMKNEFISTVNHELRTPLTAIRGALGLIAGGVAGSIPPEVQRMVDIACTNSDRLIRLISDMLDLEKMEAGKLVFSLRPIALLPLVGQAIEANRAYGQQFGVSFMLESAGRDIWVNVDSDRLIQALTNLLANAAKFSPRDDTVLVRVSRAGDRVRLAISDHGPGVPESFRAQLFQKFAQADSSDTREKGGTGLGLSITKAIVEKMSGRIEADSNASGGATFTIDLPAWHTSPPGQASEPAPLRLAAHNTDINSER